MATVTKTATPTKRRPAAPAKKRPPARSRPASRTKAKVKSGPSAGARLGAALKPHSPDLAGAGLLVLAALAALGIWFDLTGPFGRDMRSWSSSAVGLGRVLVPLVVAGLGIALLRRRSVAEGSHDQPPVRVGIGLVLLVVAGCGLLDLIAGPAAKDAGGWLGHEIAGHLRQVLATGGAAVVLVVVLGIAALVITRTSVRRAWEGASVAGRWIGRQLLALWRWIIDLGHQEDAPVAVQPEPFAAREPEPAPEPQPDPDPEPRAIEVHLPEEPTPPGQQLEIDLGPAAEKGQWKLPPVSVLQRGEAAEIDRKLLESEGHVLEEALAAHGVQTRLVGMTVGPTVTRYELELGPGVKVARVTSLHKDIAYAMASPDVRILAPIPGRSAIGVEVPNKRRQLVMLGDILTSDEARRATHPLEVAVGRDIAGRAVMENLAAMPHVLIAGATGAGK